MKSIGEFMKFFRGLEDGYGEEVNGKIKNRKRPVTGAIFRHHLLGRRKIGIYPLRRDGTCYWSLLDFDGEGEEKEEIEKKAKLVYQEALKLGIEPAPERSSSGIGIHLWFFYKDRVQGWKVRKLLFSLLELAGLEDDSKIEVFPKQDELGPKNWGNFVFLPLQGKLRKENKTIFLNWEGDIDFEGIRILKKELNDLVPERLNPRRKQFSIGKKTALEILAYFDVELKQMEIKNDEIWGLCPFHKETKPSFSINNKAKYYYCFGCGRRGYIDSVIEELAGEKFTELARQARIEEAEDKIYSNREGEDIEIADFGFRISQLYRMDNGEIMREFIFSQTGNKLKVLTPGQAIGTRINFKNYCLTQGPYHFKGNDFDLQKLVKDKDEEAMRKGICISHNDFGFRDPTSFDTTRFIVRKGKVHFPDEDGIFRTEGEILKMEVSKDIADFCPFSKTPQEFLSKGKKTKRNLLSIFRKVYPDKEIEIVLGWTFASIYSPEIRAYLDMFPILFLVGPNSTGKTCLARNLLGLWGMQAVLTVGKGSTYTGVKRALESPLGTPVCVDDYRNMWAMQEKDDLLRSSFDSIPGFKGKKEGRKVYKELATATLIGTGEELPVDTGLRARLIPVRLEVRDHPDTKAFSELEQTIFDYSPILIEEIRKKSSKRWQDFQSKIDLISGLFFELLHHSRQAKIWAIPVAGYYHFFNEKPTREKIRAFVSSAKEEKTIREEEDLVSDFLITLDTLLGENKITDGTHFIIESDKLYLRLKPCHHIWAERLSRRREEVKYTRLRTELEGKKYTISVSQNKRYPPGTGLNLKYVVINLNKIPEDLIPTFLQRLSNE